MPGYGCSIPWDTRSILGWGPGRPPLEIRDMGEAWLNFGAIWLNFGAACPPGFRDFPPPFYFGILLQTGLKK